MGTPSRSLSRGGTSGRTFSSATPTSSRTGARAAALSSCPHPLGDDNDAAVLLRLSRSRMEDEEESPTSAVSDDDDDDNAENDEACRRGWSARRYDHHEDERGGASVERGVLTGTPTSSLRRQSAPSSPLHGLESLRQCPVPPLPDEQDRKRFIGCLAAVLASSCDHYSSRRSGGASGDSEAERIADDVGDNSWTEQLSRSESRAFSSCDDDDSDEDESHRHARGDSGGIAANFDRDGRRYAQRHAEDDRDGRLNSSFDGAFSGSGARKVAASNLRYRERRYAICSQLLLSSADLLQVERGQAKAFLPMLSKILMPSRSKSRHSPRESCHSQAVPEGCTVSESCSDEGKPNGTCRAQTLTSNVIPTTARESDLLLQEHMDRIEHVRPFLESMTPGSGFRCLCFFLLQHLMHAPDGYDARVRHSIKTLAVLLLVKDMEHDLVDYLAEGDNSNLSGEALAGFVAPSQLRQARDDPRDRLLIATRKFEALEQYLAAKLLQLSRQQRPVGNQGVRQPPSSAPSGTISQSGVSKEQIWRSLKIGGTAVVAGTLFAVTGGLAAPGIAAGVAAIAGGTAAAAAATAVLTSTAAVTAIFGVGGGGLAAYKMQRRTKGLTEFEFHKESDANSADLFLTIAISGWLRDECDFQRPWGVSPRNPPLRDRLELLERFYFVHSPEHVPKCRRILQSWEGEEAHLWRTLALKYGRDPSNLFPLNGPRTTYRLTLEQVEAVDKIFIELGYVAGDSQPLCCHSAPAGVVGTRRITGHADASSQSDPTLPVNEKAPCRGVPVRRDDLVEPFTTFPEHDQTQAVIAAVYDSRCALADAGDTPTTTPKHLLTVWDYGSNYGGELYTVKWEGELMTELCDSVSDLAFELVSGGTAQILKHTALSTIMSAIAWPYALVNAANMIDSTWTLAVERADEAGLELARSLLFSGVGHRPVTLVGFSFGARAIYACLKELSRYQSHWEKYHLHDNRNSKRWRETTSIYKGMREPASIVEDAILMGLPNHLSTSSWIACRQVVAGRLVNCFSQKDLVLSLMFQFKRLGLKPVCGTCTVEVDGVENIDVSDLVSGHQDYCVAAGRILNRVRHGQPSS